MKKYSDKFLNQIFKLKKSIIGFEFEFYMKNISYYKTLELLNQELSPVKVWGFRQYHSGFTTDENNFKIEPDLSGGSNMVELITGPLNYIDSKYYLIKILNFIQNYGYTNDKTSIHINISFNDEKLDLNNVNILKLILNINEDEIYKYYPSRKNNVYAKSVKKIIPYKEYDFSNIPISIVKNNMKLPNDKYYGINFLNIVKNKKFQRLEYRYIGGKDYEKNIGQIIYFMEKFIIYTYNSINSYFNNNDMKLLDNYLEERINSYKSLSSYDNFIVEYPTIQLQIDQNNNYDIVSTYYTKIYTKIYELVNSIENIKECIINYVSETKTIEIVDTDIKSIFIIKDVYFINCNLEGIFENCNFINSEIYNSQLTKCEMKMSEANDSKLYNCEVNDSAITNCYFQDGYLNGSMTGGVYRSGKLGPHAEMSSDVKLVTDYNNFFNTDFDKENNKENIKGFDKKITK